ncbi:MAG TPA: NAD(P)H-dependent oxidoreductase subunit E [Gemmatimonadales bacterium]
MDLKLSDAQPTAEERAAVDALLGAPDSGWDGGARLTARDGHVAFGGHAARDQRHLLLPALHALQSSVGWISEGGLMYVCLRLTVPPADAWGVATFYGLLATMPRPRRVLHICDDIACRMKGAKRIIDRVKPEAGNAHHLPEGDTIELTETAWLSSPCLGLCDQAPAGLATIAGPEPLERLIGALTADEAAGFLKTGSVPARPRPKLPQQGDAGLTLLKRVGTVSPTDIAAYESSGGFAALRRAIEIGAAAVIREVTTSKLMGRGGAAFPTGRKWDAVAGQPEKTRYVICNADESEPGTFKDRVLLEEDPFAIVEAITIAGFAVAAQYGYVYIRGEYPLAIERVENAIARAHASGWLGKRIGGADFDFDIEVRKGAGAYICGEETAIFNSIEGYRGEPRNKPPFPVESGLFRKPTVVNNVETLANIPAIVLEGGAAFAQVGSGDSTGPKLFCLSGAVQRPGVYEVPFGATLRGLLDMAGASPASDTRAILLGGAAGMFVSGDQPDFPLTFEGARAAGVTLGSGVIMVFDKSADIPDMLLRIAAFFRDESCGQCVPCRVGTVRQEEALHRLATKKSRLGTAGELALLAEIGTAMKDASICGLGQTAYSAVESAVKKLNLFETAEPR